MANATEDPKDGFQTWLDSGPQTMTLMFFLHLTKGLLPSVLESLLGQVFSQGSKDTHRSCAPLPQRGATGASSRSSQSPNSAVSRQPPGAAPGDKSKVRKKSGGCMGGSLGGMRQSHPPPGGWWAGWFPSSPGLAQWLRNQVYSEGTGSGNSGGNPPIKKQEFTTNMKAAPYKAGGSC